MFFALGVATLLWAPAAAAQGTNMRMDIPFAFVAGDEVFPAGQYLVTVDRQFGRCIFVSRTDATTKAIRLSATSDTRSLENGSLGTMRFILNGGQYFLTNVWRTGQEDGFRIVPSKRMLQAATARANGGAATIVTLN